MTETQTTATRQDVRMLAHRQRKVSVGVHLSFLNADLVESLGLLGFHWLFLDGERTSVTPSNCRDLVRAADLAGMFCVARVTSVNVLEIGAYLDSGVLGILAPRISSAEQARQLVASVKCRTRGRGRIPSTATFAAALIETEDGIEHLDEILAVPGLDFLALGPNDLAHSLACDDTEHPRVKELLESARRRLQAAGRPLISVVSQGYARVDEVEQGATLVAVPDTSLLADAAVRFLAQP